MVLNNSNTKKLMEIYYNWLTDNYPEDMDNDDNMIKAMENDTYFEEFIDDIKQNL